MPTTRSKAKESAEANLGPEKQAVAGVTVPPLSSKWDHFAQRLLIHCGGLFTVLMTCIFFHDNVFRTAPDPGYYHPIIGSFLLGYFLVLVVSRVLENGSWILLEILWCCNIAIFCAAVAMFIGRPRIVGCVCIGVICDQACWYVDLIIFVVTGQTPIGVVKYLWHPRIKFARKMTSAHHLWFVPVCLYTMGGTFPCYSWLLSCVFTSTSTLYARFATPCSMIDPATGKEERLNVNMAYGFWDDVKVPFLHKCDNSPLLVYLTFMLVVFNPIANGSVFVATKMVHHYISPFFA